MKQTKKIFVVMPFVETPTRDKDDLLYFFEHHLKSSIEKENGFIYNYLVYRSSDIFGITEQIIIDLYESDMVICDLSGIKSNPNVMYELGIRLAISNNPVILIREKNPDNKTIFDISGYFTFEYNPKQYNYLEKHIIDKIKSFENGKEKYSSPVLKTLENAPTVINRIIRQNNWDRLVLFQTGIYHYLMSQLASVSHFIQKNNIDINTSSENEVLESLYEKEEILTQLNWNEYKLVKPKIPALEEFLTFPPITGLNLESDTHQRVIGYVMTYFNHVVQNIENIFDGKFAGIRGILRETSILNQLAVELVTSYLRNIDLSKEINRIIEMSALKNNIPQGIVMIRLDEE
jgi:hypothetical protein